MADTTLDCRNLSCPLPIVRLSRVMKTLALGEALTVRAADPAFRADLDAWLRKQGHALEAFEDGLEQRAVIRKGA